MMMQTTRKLKVTIDKTDYRADVTIDWNGFTDEQFQHLAGSKLMNNLGVTLRNAGKAISDKISIRAIDYASAKQAQMTHEQAASYLTIEELEAIIAAKRLS